ncbi:MAG: hypothetical protein P1P86_05615 [Bacteroidales bacterium]|nr:hypothetical protein [Bacteroidales bacterium]
MKKGPGYRIMVYMSKRMIACDQSSFLISLREDRRLSLKQWWQLNMHLLTCHLCRKYAHQIGELNLSMKVYRDHCSEQSCTHHLSAEAGSRIGREIGRRLNAK